MRRPETRHSNQPSLAHSVVSRWGQLKIDAPDRGDRPIAPDMHRRLRVPGTLAALLQAQAGVVTTAQVLGLGLSQEFLRSQLRQGRFARVAQGVYVDLLFPHSGPSDLGGSAVRPDSRSPATPGGSAHVSDQWPGLIPDPGQPSKLLFQQRCWAGHLAAGDGSAIGGQAALHLRGVGDAPGTVTVLVPRARRVLLPAGFVPLRDGEGRLPRARGVLPVACTDDAVLDATRNQSVEAFVSAATDCLRLRLTTPQRLETALRNRAKHTNRAELLEVLADLQGLESNLEFRFMRDVVRAHDLPKGTRQYRIGSRRVDVLHERYRVAIELDGKLGHVPGRFRDLARDNEFMAQGIATLRYGSFDVRTRPCAVARQIADVLTLSGWDGVMRTCPACRPQ